MCPNLLLQYLGGEDDLSQRPPWIYVQKRKGDLELNELLQLVGRFGRIDARSLSHSEAVVATGNIRTLVSACHLISIQLLTLFHETGLKKCCKS